MPVRRACAGVGLSKSAYYAAPGDWVSRDREVIEALQTLADQYPRRGFWKYYKMLRRAGRGWNHKRIYRVYCKLKLNQRRRAKRRVPVRQPQPLWVPERPNVMWSADFMSDALYHGMLIEYIESGEPNQNAYIERFNRTYREEVLDLYLFETLDQVREITHRWLIDYNEHRPHDSLDDLPPIEYAELAKSSTSEVSA